MQYNIPQVWNVNKNIPVPLFKQLADNIKWSICLGNISDGYRLPPVRQIAKELNISVDTVRASYKLLEEMGLVVTRPNHGTEVIKQQEGGGVPKYTDGAGENEFIKIIENYFSRGFSSDDVKRIFLSALEKEIAKNEEKLLFVDCNEEDCRNFSRQLYNYLNIPVDYLMTEDLETAEKFENKNYKAIVTTYFHYSLVLQSLKPLNIPIYGVVTELSTETLSAIKKFTAGAKIGVICQPNHSTQYLISLIENVRSDLCIRSFVFGKRNEIDRFLDWADVFFVTNHCREQVMSKRPDAPIYYFCDQINAQSVGLLRESLNSLCP